jgi:hypothetical protein
MILILAWVIAVLAGLAVISAVLLFMSDGDPVIALCIVGAIAVVAAAAWAVFYLDDHYSSKHPHDKLQIESPER